MTAGRRRVVLTGAAGRIGQAVAAMLAQRWDLHRTDLRPGADAVLDVTDIAACRLAFAGADAVVHLGAVPDPDASWEQLLPTNVIGAHCVVQAAMDSDVRRLVLASSLHAVGGYPRGRQVRQADAPAPTNLYGASKAWLEALGAWAAHSSSTSAVALRIGYFGVDPPSGPDVTDLQRAAWLSARDCAELIRAAVEAEGLTWVVANGISANRHRFADLSDTQALLGYRPIDDAWAGR
jgi:nucleoside-diphosphate-sugar epimerase